MTGGGADGLRLTVPVTAAPAAHLLRGAIADAVAGRGVGNGPEAQVARAVARAVSAARAEAAR
ncbi:hypothetical protein [Yinghuangia seranimata]|uniref:hypothetical protein n=1 Tax=Yinghuangia seranimata TaxID=408067 RepID=UPI00248CAB39|nr:hypothetical protein [Yinghuangia seranimata]MDI2131691.1 hypothetical protein [Yinghuangia seranimata]